jgi:lysophosphatidate acyltransferase
MASSAPKAVQLSVRVPTKALGMSFISLIVKPLAYLGLPSYLLHRLSKSSPRTRYYICNVLYVCCLGFCSFLGFSAAFPLYLLGRRYDVNFIVARTFYAIFSRLSGLRIIVEGEEHLQTRPCVFVVNHQSMIDVLCLGRCVASPTYLLHGLISRTVCSRREPK